jgi:2-polyprenyl-3-methyl-5-hydroxy-6-metoxy-1,4-benzoquinol methylase
MDQSNRTTQFDFGQNWLEYSRNALTPERIRAASEEFTYLHAGIPLNGHSFLEIGFGQGLSLLFASRAGARVVGCDINPKCAEALAVTREHFSEAHAEPRLVIGSILDAAVARQLQTAAPDGSGFYDVVHSWGVLHHTGDMTIAIRHAAGLVRPGGHLVIAIYNRHWSSLPWLGIKWAYVHSPRWIQHGLIKLLAPVIYAAKWIVTGRDPRRQQRGMDFYYNVVDWVGGYPYEYASVQGINRRMEGLGFTPVRSVAAEVPTGCNEFVFQKQPATAQVAAK